MARVLRTYEHRDFSDLLEELNRGSTSVQSAGPGAAAIFEVSLHKRRRDSLMSNPRMRYAYSAATLVFHDRDCPHVKDIPDEAFEMLAVFPTELERCPHCYRKALIRAAIVDDFKRINAYVNIFNLLRAKNDDLYTLFVENRASVFRVSLDSVCIKVHEDTWMIHADQGVPVLYHNNYSVLEDYKRLFTGGFHLQNDGGFHNFRHFTFLMTKYSWEEHAKTVKAKELAYRRERFRQELAKIPTYRKDKRFSLLFSYYTFVDCKKKAKHFCRRHHVVLDIVNQTEEAETPYAVVVCRIWRWKSNDFRAAMTDFREYLVQANHFEFGEYCRKMLLSALRY